MKNPYIKFNVWSNHVKHIQFKTLHEIYDDIKGGVYKDIVEKIRNSIKQGDKSTANTIKSQLNGFTLSGIFDSNKNRKRDYLENYTGVIVLDIDNLKEHEIEIIFDKIISNNYTLMAFISPSGVGIKIIVATNNEDLNLHKNCYQDVVNFYSRLLNVNFDEQTNDLTRLCYFSFDSNAYYNENAELFIIKKENRLEPVEQTQSKKDFDFESKIQYAIRYTENKVKFINGTRNKFIYLLSANCNRHGLNQQDVINFCFKNYVQPDFTDIEIKQTIESSYQQNLNDFGKWDKGRQQNIVEVPKKDIPKIEAQAKDTNEIDNYDNAENEISLNTPFIEDFVKDQFPEYLKRIINRLSSEREKDVFVTGIITALSGAIEAHGIYNNRKYYAPIYSFISAPPASGKGALNYCQKIILPLHKTMKDESEEAQRTYEIELSDYNERKRKKEKNIQKPEKPQFRTLLIPANSSSSQIMEHLQDNGERGLMIETEADTLTKTLESDFGNFSDILRRAFEHEHLSQRRKTNKEYLEVYDPRLAIALSGTPNQLKKLINSVENGLFSRFIYYVFEKTSVWGDVSPQKNENISLATILSETGKMLAPKLLLQQKNPIEFTLSDNQWERLNKVFANWTKEISCFVGEDISANVFRLGCITFRIAMVLTTLKKIEENHYSSEKIVCEEDEFNMALSLSKTYYMHLEYAFKLIKDSNEVINQNLKNFISVLPSQFDRKTAIELYNNKLSKVHERTIDKYLNRLITYGYLKKNVYNSYDKIANT